MYIVHVYYMCNYMHVLLLMELLIRLNEAVYHIIYQKKYIIMYLNGDYSYKYVLCCSNVIFTKIYLEKNITITKVTE
jgi:hypothetical protein